MSETREEMKMSVGIGLHWTFGDIHVKTPDSEWLHYHVKLMWLSCVTHTRQFIAANL